MVMYAVIGLGQLGTAVALELTRGGGDVIAIDSTMSRVEALKDHVARALCMNATDDRAMRASGVGEASTVVLAFGEKELEEAVLSTMILRELGVGAIVSRASSDLQGKVLERVGVTKVIYPERQIGLEVARHILTPSVRELIPLSEGTALAELEVKKEHIGLSLAGAHIRQNFGLNVVALRRCRSSTDDDGSVVEQWSVDHVPGPGTVMREGDILVVVGSDEALRGWSEP